MDKAPINLQGSNPVLANPDNCHEFMVILRWRNGKVTCPHRGSEDVAYIPNVRVFKCYQKHERQKFFLKVGTIFEGSPLGLDKWLPVIWTIVNCKNGYLRFLFLRSIMPCRTLTSTERASRLFPSFKDHTRARRQL